MRKINFAKIASGLVALFLFILAIQLMKVGAKQLAPLLRDASLIRNPVNSLGFGWLGAYFVLSGSPVAAAALGLHDGGALDQIQTFMMISGSRMGASFIVLFIGFIYILRGHESKRTLGTGLISLITTWTTYVLTIPIGLLILSNGWLDTVRLAGIESIGSALDRVFDPIIDWISSWAPGLLIFVVGVGIIIVAFNLIDRALPEIQLSGTRFGEAPRLLYRPIVMFGLGLLVTSASMSVSVSLGLLVPLSARGYIRIENVIPYIMGANVTTFVDTLVVSLLMSNPSAFTIVLVQMISVTLSSLIILIVSYRRYERLVLHIVGVITRNRRNQSIFMLALVSVPILLLLL